jgi:two-component system, chemotaxis family, chemotaxis protein CheY
VTNKNILIVDDSRVARITIRELIKRINPNYKVVDIGTPLEALELVEKESFDLISLDYNMPDLNGLELAIKIQEKGIKTKIIILTANIQQTIKNKVESLGIFFQQKPINESTIRSILEKVE